MMKIEECLKYDTMIYLTKDESRNNNLISKIFNRRKTPRLYIKNFNHAEFIGEGLCNIKNIRCTHYFLAGLGMYKLERNEIYGKISKENYSIKIASYNFKNKRNSYFLLDNCDILSSNDKLSSVLNMANNEKNKEELLNEILAMFALDIFMGQQDRFYNNIMFERRENGDIHLAPLYDFELSLKQSYIDQHFIYKNDLHSFRDINDIKEFIEKHPKFKEELLSYLNIDLVNCAKNSYSQRGLIIPEKIIGYLDDFSDSRKQLIKEVTK